VQEGAFDEAVKGVDAVAHTASPFHMNADDPKELFDPAINGTLGVLKSIQKNNKDVKRVVITRSASGSGWVVWC
jgi:nucleoside-diphosphate-sugar epimerase